MFKISEFRIYNHYKFTSPTPFRYYKILSKKIQLSDFEYIKNKKTLLKKILI